MSKKFTATISKHQRQTNEEYEFMRSGYKIKAEIPVDKFKGIFSRIISGVIKRLYKKLGSGASSKGEEFIGQVVLCNPRKNHTNRRHFCKVTEYRDTDYLQAYVDELKNVGGNFRYSGSSKAVDWVHDVPMLINANKKGLSIESRTISVKSGDEGVLLVNPFLREDGAPPDVLPIGHSMNQIKAYKVPVKEAEVVGFDDAIAAFVIQHNS